MVLQPAAAFWGISCQQTTPAFRWKITLLDNGAGKHCLREDRDTDAPGDRAGNCMSLNDDMHGLPSGTSSPHLRRDRELSNNKEGELAGHSSSYGCPHAHFLNGFEYNQEADMRQQEGRTATNSLASQPCAGSPFCAVDGISTHCQQVQSHGEGRSKAAAFVSSVEAGDSSAASNGVPGVLLAISDLFSAATVCFGMENCPSYLR